MNAPHVFVITHESAPTRTDKSTSIISLALLRSLGPRGARVVRVHPNRLERSLASRWCSAVEVCPDFYSSEEQLVEFLLGMARRYEGERVIIPASDDCAWFLARHHQRLAHAFAIVGPPWTVMEKIGDKQSQYQHAEAAGLPIPETYCPGSAAEVEHLASRLQNFPYVIKPLVAQQWRLASMQGVSKGKKGFSVRTPEELLSRYAEIARGDSKVLIQEVIGGRDERLLTFLGYCSRDSEAIAYCVRKKIRQLPLDFGYCTATVSCHDEIVVEQSRRLLKAVGFSGICGVEWKQDPRTGRYKLIEINARAVNTLGIARACGVDLPWIAVADALGRNPAPVHDWRDGVVWTNIVKDTWAARDLWHAGQLTIGPWLRSLKGARVDAVFSVSDPWPFFGYLGEAFEVSIRSRLRAKPRLSVPVQP